MAVDKILLNTDILKKLFNYKGAKTTLQNNNKELQLPYFFGKKADFTTSKLACQKISYLRLWVSYRKYYCNSIHLNGVYSFRILR